MMKLVQTIMNMPIAKGLDRATTPKLVMLWEQVGLCVHKGSYVGKHEKVTYHVSHFNSGMSILRGIRSSEEAKKYMQRVHDEVLVDWRFTIADWESEENSSMRSELKQLVDAIQQKIYKGE